MKEEVFNGIKYQLDEEILTADVIENVGRECKVDIPEVVVFNEVSYRVTRIKVEGFSGYSSLTSITIPKSVTSIEPGAFSGCDSLVSIVVAEGNTVYDSRDNCNAIIEKATNTLICGCRNTTIPNSVTSIGVRAFNECFKLTTITIPDSVTEIGTRAFANCHKLTDITIPDSVTSIGERAFLWCFSLSTITIPNSVTTIGKRAFSGCGVQTVIISDGVTSIGEEAFLDCESLEEIVIGNSVKSIGSEAFCRCEMLSNIRFQGTIAQWERIELGDGWNDEVCTTVVSCSDGDVFSVATIDGLHYIKSVVTTTKDSYELTLLCDTLWEREVLEVPATVVYQGKEYTVTGIDVGQSTKLENLHELRIPPTVRHIFPEACVGIKSLRKVNIPDHCRVYSGAFAECGIEELILGEYVILEEGCFDGIRAKQVNVPDTTKWVPSRIEDESDSCIEPIPVSADSMYDILGFIFRYSIWHYMELLKRARKGDEWAKREFASGISSMNFMISITQNESLYKPTFSPAEILCLLDESEKHWISQFEENQERIMNMYSSDDDLPF